MQNSRYLHRSLGVISIRNVALRSSSIQLSGMTGGRAGALNNLQIQGIPKNDSRIVCFSSNSGIWDKVKGLFDRKMESRKVDKTRAQIEKMAKLDTWTLQCFLDELNEGLSDWAAKIPGMGQLAQKKQMDDTKRILDAIVAQTGGSATPADLAQLDRKQKLTICVNGNITLQELNLVISQFTNMEMMHRVVRYRQQLGKPLPTDETSLKAVMFEDGRKVVTQEEMKEMREANMKQQLKSMGMQAGGNLRHK